MRVLTLLTGLGFCHLAASTPEESNKPPDTKGKISDTVEKIGLASSAVTFSSPTPPTTTLSTTSKQSELKPGSKPKNNAGAVAGGVVGGILFLALLAVAILIIMRRLRKPKPSHGAIESVGVTGKKSRTSSPTSHASPQPVVPAAHSAHHLAQTSTPPPPTTQEPTRASAPYAQPAPIAQHHTGPAELQSREVDQDGVSVNSFDMERGETRTNNVPRLPI